MIMIAACNRVEIQQKIQLKYMYQYEYGTISILMRCMHDLRAQKKKTTLLIVATIYVYESKGPAWTYAVMSTHKAPRRWRRLDLALSAGLLVEPTHPTQH